MRRDVYEWPSLGTNRRRAPRRARWRARPRARVERDVVALARALDACADALGDAGEANHARSGRSRQHATRWSDAERATRTRDAFAVLCVEHTDAMWTACVDAASRGGVEREATRATEATLRDVAAAARDAERAWAAKRARGVARELEEVELRYEARVRAGEDGGAKSAARGAISSGGDGRAGRARRRRRGETSVDVVARFRALEREFLWREECVLRGERGASALEASVRAFEPDLRVGALALATTRAARWRERVATFEGRRDDDVERRRDRDVIARMEAQHPALVAQYVMWMKDAALESSARAASSAVAAATTHLYDFLLALDADVYDARFRRPRPRERALRVVQRPPRPALARVAVRAAASARRRRARVNLSSRRPRRRRARRRDRASRRRLGPGRVRRRRRALGEP